MNNFGSETPKVLDCYIRLGSKNRLNKLGLKLNSLFVDRICLTCLIFCALACCANTVSLVSFWLCVVHKYQRLVNLVIS